MVHLLIVDFFEFRESMCSKSSEKNVNIIIEVLFKMKIKSPMAFLARVFVYVFEIFGTSVHNTVLTLSLCYIEYLAYTQFVVMT